jgi:hypothetical protein
MTTFEQFLRLKWPDEFVVEYLDGKTETLLRGEGVTMLRPEDDPEGFGGFSAELPKKHPRNQAQGCRHVRFTEVKSLCTASGQIFWSRS